MEKIRNFRDLEVWKLGKVLVLLVYRVAKKFPQEELYGLVSQMRRAAVSVPSNVAEGFNRGTTPNIGSSSISRWARVQNRKRTSKLLMT